MEHRPDAVRAGRLGAAAERAGRRGRRGRAADAAHRAVGFGAVLGEGSQDRQRLINARSETITEKPPFKAAAARRRCLVPADGYYEWQNTDEGEVPYLCHRADCARSG